MSGLTIVVPMAGLGKRFRDAGYATPKPFIRVHGRPMTEVVLDNVAWPGASYVLIAQRAHVEADPEAVQEIRRGRDVTWVLLDGLTEGTACTLLAAEPAIPADRPMLVANSDQHVAGGVAGMLQDAIDRDLDGSILVFPEPGDPKWSYARVDDGGLVTEVAEKVPISDLATVGIYHFRSPERFFAAARRMIAADERVNGEFYTCPVYNWLIREGARIGVHAIPPAAMSGLGTPDDLARFVAAREAVR